MRLHATDSDAWYEVGSSHDIQTIHGSKASLLAWLMGRTKATDLTTQDGAALPEPPFLY
jgi:hypothetical protein